MVVTTKEGDVALLRNLVMKEKVIVMALVMVVNMMAMLGVRETLYVGATTVPNLELSIILRMTVVRSLAQGVHQEVRIIY